MDSQLFHWLNNLAGQSRAFDVAVIFLAEYLPYAIVLAFLALLFYSGYKKREKIRIFWVTLFSVAIARYGAVELIRFFYHRQRPFVAYDILPLFPHENSWSFPSGHAALFFALAAALYFYNKKWGAWFFLAAVLISVARVIAGVHYPSDILGGALVGIAAAYVVVFFAEKNYKTR